MRRITMSLGVAALMLATTTAFAQARPNFSGKWTLIPDSTAAAAGRGMAGARNGNILLGNEPTIKQDEKLLTVTTTLSLGGARGGAAAAPAPVTFIYNLDGTDSPNTLTLMGTSVETTSKTKWDADKLLVTTTLVFGGNVFDVTMTFSLDAAGNMVVESSLPNQQTGAPSVSKATFKKA